MLAKVNSCAVIGLDGEVVEVEVDVSQRAAAVRYRRPAAIRRSRRRGSACARAIRNSGPELPEPRITANLAPADLRKEGPAYDLPIAVGILIATGQVPEPSRTQCFLGELSLDGRVRHTQGVLPMVGLARERGFTQRLRAGG